MLAMSSAIAGVGLGLGILLIFTSAIASAFGLFLLTKVAEKSGRQSSFFACSKLTYPKAAIFFDLAIAIKCFGVSVSYLVICSDLLPQVVSGFFPLLVQDSIFRSKTFWVSICSLSIAPISFSKSINSLQYTSALALSAVIYLLIIVIYFYSDSAINLPRLNLNDIIWMKFDSKFFTYLPIFVFAFTCHQNIFSVYNELIENNEKNIKKVIFYSVGTSFAVYQTIGILGYLTFGNSVTSNIIAMYPHSSFVTGGQLAIAILVLLSYPLQCHPCRASLDKVISSGIRTTFSKKRHVLITSGIMISSYLLAISIKNLSTVLSVVGATGSTTICYILPGLFYFKLRENSDTIPKWDLIKVCALGLAASGVLIMSTSLTSLVLGASSTTH